MPSVRSLPAPLQSPLRAVVRAGGRATSSYRMLPAFLLVGTQRGGTTSLHRALRQHPAVLAPIHRKGLRYFDLHYARGPEWYRGHFPLLSRARLLERSLGTAPLTMESSPYYMFHPLAPARIGADLPEVKLLAILRDPVERAYSAHAHELARGFESEPFERALELEPQRLEGEVERMRSDPTYVSRAHQHNAYLSRGHYADQLERLEQVVGRDRLLVVDSHRFFTDPAPVFAEVTAFLGLPAHDGVRFERHNPRPRAPLPAGLRRRLEAHFEPYDERLAAWLGKSPGWRR